MAYLSGCCKDEEEGLGLDITSVLKTGASQVPVVGGILSSVGSLFGGNSKDPGRLAKNAQWFAECSAGGQDACTALKYMSGRYGLTNTGQYCNQGGCSGWATQKAKDDAYAKYQQTQQATAYSEPVSTPSSPVKAALASATGGMNPLLIMAGIGLAVAMSGKKRR